MTSQLRNTVDDRVQVCPGDVDEYNRQGVVLFKNVFPQKTIDLLRSGLERDLSKPGPLSRDWAQDEADKQFFYDTICWPRIAEFRDFIFHSPAAAMAAKLMNAKRVRVLNDALFYRSAGTQTPSPFHQDVPYLPVEGKQICSVWMPLVPVRKESSLQFVRGSHSWGRVFERPDFGNPDASDTGAPNYERLPDIEQDPDAHDLTSWAMEPGDCVFFHGMMIHGGSGNLPPERSLEVFAINWLGDDVTVKIRPKGMDPDLSAICAIYGLSDGDPVGSDAFPVVWPKL